MKTYNECIPCIINQGLKIAKVHNLSDEKTEKMIKESMQHLIEQDFSKSPPQLAKKTYEIINKHLDNNDPYKEMKVFYNNEIMKIADNLKKIISENDNSFLTAVKFVIAGNLIDFGAKHTFNKDSVLDFISKVEDKKLVIDNSGKLFKQLSSAKKVLYIGDNCGEIVFDKIFIEYLQKIFPSIDFHFGVRGRPVINDITIDDAVDVGIDKIATVISNGDGAPGTVLEDVTDEFRKLFMEVDVIIAKGQGNYETLNNVNKDNLFSLFMAKCNIVADDLKVPQMSLICKKM